MKQSRKQHNASGVYEYIDTSRIKDVVDAPKDQPYAIWTHDANKYRQNTVVEAQRNFSKDEQGATQHEVTALYLQKPDIFRDHGIDAAGSCDAGGFVPDLDTFHLNLNTQIHFSLSGQALYFSFVPTLLN